MTARKNFFKLILPALAAYAGTCFAADSAVVYFTKYENVPASSVDSLSRASYYPQEKSGVTAFVAQEIAKQTGSEIFSIKTKSKYPASLMKLYLSAMRSRLKECFRVWRTFLRLTAFRRFT